MKPYGTTRPSDVDGIHWNEPLLVNASGPTVLVWIPAHRASDHVDIEQNQEVCMSKDRARDLLAALVESEKAGHLA